jgi:hypothetical protein
MHLRTFSKREKVILPRILKVTRTKNWNMLVDRDFIESQFDNVEEYRKFLFQYLKTRDLPDDVKRFLADLEK